MLHRHPEILRRQVSIKPERVERFKAALAESKIKPANVVVHAAYVLSVATPDDDKWARASGGLTKELERSSALGVGCVCFHPGSAGDERALRSAKRIAKAIVAALETVDSSTRASHREHRRRGSHHGADGRRDRGDSLGHSDVAARANGLRTRHVSPLFVGVRHHESKKTLTAILDEFEEKTGEPPSFFHLNDSEGSLDPTGTGTC